MKKCQYEDDSEHMHLCPDYEAKATPPKIALDWKCLYYTRLNGLNMCWWPEGLKKEKDK
jgi:hypothetical protein